MKKDSGYKDYILYDVLGHIEGMTARAMFGGWSLYKDGVIVGIIADGIFYLKGGVVTDGASSESFPFTYTHKNGTVVTMPYHSVPESLFEQPFAIEEKVMHSYMLSSEHKRE